MSKFPLLTLTALFSLASADEPLLLQAPQVKALGIALAVVGQGDAGRAGTLPARVLVPNEQMRLVTAPLAGMIEQLAVAPGMRVRRGQIVARLASPQALELQRDALQAGSQSGLLRQNLQRDEQLFAEGLIPESRLQATRAAAAQAAAQADERARELALAGLAPGRLGGPLALLAPIDGVVLEQGVQLGQRVESSALIYRIARLNPLWLEIQAPQAVAAQLREGTRLKLRGGGEAGLSARLIAIGRAIDPASQTVLLRAEVSQGAEQLTPGQVVEVETAGGPRLPAAALARSDGKDWIFTCTPAADQGLRCTPRAVRVLAQGGDGIQVDGLQAGEQIAVKGVSGLKAMLTGVGR